MNDPKELRNIAMRLGLTAALVLCVSTATLVLAARETAVGFVDPLDSPATHVSSPATQPVTAVAAVQQRLIGVGMRGVIVVSDDHGVSWRQVASPVQSDLTAVMFATARDGWAVGHDGVILHSADGGNSWVKQFDGRMAAQQFARRYRAAIAAGDMSVQPALQEVERNSKAGPALPWLDVWFEDATHGYAVGSFGTFAMTSDGGKTWLPALEHIDNPSFLNLNAIRAIAGQLYIAGERGMVYRLDRVSGRFEQIATGYGGSYFGIAGTAGRVFAFGLRGNVYRSSDGGTSWTRVETGTDATLNAASVLADGSVVLAGTGTVLINRPGEAGFSRVPVGSPMLFAGIAPDGDDAIALCGPFGIWAQALPGRAAAQPVVPKKS
ncbi:photosynthesis system II assembly factor YCF48 family protein [Paraburkholderia caffeinilytica]|uniref:Photosynthesis system II assembly factor Ycf48/Hcf136-like domain-containing protein n=1 Tax=Paraburkholderia caffeinilytica TaxID=1761016 RepID=A0ABQ1LMQ2_9BURK|nr:YCF48-related protein [Paraburkholderia caffeinilytica]AXL53665.1 photosynthesis system II assembly factor YCF48 family protein [Paraburkholderia caffeinilytica]GGC27133.1 hypothetical protein GCM10011400_11930 [Paraburkholderia caffeinilytica]CAB3780080.1 Ycf48-like protein [Paraburkholderia caffeinilytica]